MELCEAGARARAGTLGGAAPPETGRARPWRGLRAWPEDERACGGGWARVRARPRPRARPAPQARIDAGHRAPGPGARSLRDTHAARSGTLERALQRGLLHARRSCRPRLLLLLGLALDVARALAHLHAPGGLVRPRPQTPAEHAQACSAGRRAEGPGPPLALRLPAARAAARAQGTAARARDCACSAAGRLARTTEGRRVLAGTTCGGGADAAGEGAGWRRVSVRSRGGRAGARRHRVQQRAAHQAGRLRRAGRGPAAGQGARPAACSALRAALLPSCQGASAGRGARARAARRPACSLPVPAPGGGCARARTARLRSGSMLARAAGAPPAGGRAQPRAPLRSGRPAAWGGCGGGRRAPGSRQAGARGLLRAHAPAARPRSGGRLWVLEGRGLAHHRRAGAARRARVPGAGGHGARRADPCRRLLRVWRAAVGDAGGAGAPRRTRGAPRLATYSAVRVAAVAGRTAAPKAVLLGARRAKVRRCWARAGGRGTSRPAAAVRCGRRRGASRAARRAGAQGRRAARLAARVQALQAHQLTGRGRPWGERAARLPLTACGRVQQ